MKSNNLILLFLLFLTAPTFAQQQTYCNPINLDYGYTRIPNFSEWGRHRATADPLSMKLGGFARGAGHGSTFQDNQGLYWHISTIMISVKNNFERRLGIWPTVFDQDDVMWSNTAFGDYPH